MPVKYLYGSRYFVVIFCSVGGEKPVKRAYTQLLEPGQSERKMEQRLREKTFIGLVIKSSAQEEDF